MPAKTKTYPARMSAVPGRAIAHSNGAATFPGVAAHQAARRNGTPIGTKKRIAAAAILPKKIELRRIGRCTKSAHRSAWRSVAIWRNPNAVPQTAGTRAVTMRKTSERIVSARPSP